MPVPWFQILNTVAGLTQAARQIRRRASAAGEPDELATAGGTPGATPVEARLAGVVVAALREAFDRDHQRLELEREHIEAERERAERALRLELLRQAGDREVARFRLAAAVAVLSWLGTLFFAPALLGGAPAARVMLGLGWLSLLAALAAAFAAQSRVARALFRLDLGEMPSSGLGGATAPWLIVAGLALIGLAVLAA